jgi:O-antigen/teichoic acid export membrane protein
VSDKPDKPGEQPDEPDGVETPDKDGLFGKSLSGIIWSGIERSGTAIVSVIVHIALARLLVPEHFGIVAMANVVIGFISLLKDQGFVEAIIQREDLEPLHLDTAMWAITAQGFLMAALGVALAPLVAFFFSEPELTDVFRVLVLTIPIMGTSSLPTAVLKREMDFKPLSLRALFASVVSGVIAVGLAIWGFGVWSLVFKTIVYHIVAAIILWKACKWVPRLRFSKQHFKDLFAFGANITGERVLNYFNRQFDDLLVGAVLGSKALGYYTVAYEILKGLTSVLGRTGSQVALPLFSRLQSDAKRLSGAYLTAVQSTAIIAFPIFALFIVAAPELFMLVYGPQWAPSVPLARVLALIGILHSVLLLNGPIFKARGKPSWSLWLTVLNVVGNVIGFSVAVFVFHSTLAVAAAYVIRGYLLMPVPLYYLKKLVDFRVAQFVGRLVFPTLATLAMVAAAFGVKALMPDVWLSLRTATIIVAGFGVYFGLVYLFLPESARRLVGRIREQLSK